MKYRKKPIVVEARQFHRFPIPTLLPFEDEAKWRRAGPAPTVEWEIQTLEGWLHVSDGDWIIRGIKGEFYPCKPDIFEATYEPVSRAMASDTTLPTAAELDALAELHEKAKLAVLEAAAKAQAQQQFIPATLDMDATDVHRLSIEAVRALPALLAGCRRALELEAEVREYRNMDCWQTTCRNCADQLNKSIEGYFDERNQELETQVDALRARHEKLVVAARKQLGQNSACKDLERALAEETT